MAWKRGIAILSAGSVKVTPDPRVHLVNGYSLQIKNAVPQDAGDYVCQIATLEPREITHTVEILGKYNLIIWTVKGLIIEAKNALAFKILGHKIIIELNVLVAIDEQRNIHVWYEWMLPNIVCVCVCAWGASLIHINATSIYYVYMVVISNMRPKLISQ